MSGANVSLLRYRWWVMSLVTVALLALEIIEHRPSLFALDLDFVREALVLGLAVPPAIGLGLSWLVRHESEPVGTPVLFSHKATAVERQQVLVVEDQVMGELVRSLLSQVKGFDVVGFVPRDEAALVEEIERTQPAVVVLDAATRLTDPDSLWCYLNSDLDLRVVVVSADDNTVRVYDKQQVLINRGEDLVAIIRSWIQV
jgi:hypothetical protein